MSKARVIVEGELLRNAHEFGRLAFTHGIHQDGGQTKSDEVPPGWARAPISEIAPLQRGFDLPTSQLNPGPHSVVYSNGVLHKHRRARVKGPGVVTGRSGTIGKVHFVEEDYWPHNTTLWVTSFYENDPKFVYHLYSHINLAQFLSGSGVPTLNRNDVHNHLVVYPPFPEQRAIAEAMSDVDDLLESLDALIAKKRAVKQAAMQQLLTGKSRLSGDSSEPGNARSAYKQTEVGMIPEDWEAATLRSCLCAALDYGINAAAVPFDDKLPAYLRITDIGEDNRYRPSPRVSVKHPDSDSFVLAKGDLVFARTGASVGKSYLYNPVDGALVFAGFLVRARPEPAKLDSTYCAYVVQSERYWKWVAAMSSRSGQPGINGQEYGSFRFPLPKICEQRAIASVLSDMDAGITALEQHRDKTRAIKQGMMQQLLTGQVRLK